MITGTFIIGILLGMFGGYLSHDTLKPFVKAFQQTNRERKATKEPKK